MVLKLKIAFKILELLKLTIFKIKFCSAFTELNILNVSINATIPHRIMIFNIVVKVKIVFC